VKFQYIDAIKAAIKAIRLKIEAKGFVIQINEISKMTKLNSVLGDKIKFEHIMTSYLNYLMENIREDAANKTITIKIKHVEIEQTFSFSEVFGSSDQSENTGIIWINVTFDDGLGLDMTETDNLFKPFETNSVSTVASGLGLLLASDIIRLYGGSIVWEPYSNNRSLLGFQIPFGIAANSIDQSGKENDSIPKQTSIGNDNSDSVKLKSKFRGELFVETTGIQEVINYNSSGMSSSASSPCLSTDPCLFKEVFDDRIFLLVDGKKTLIAFFYII
jgi:hypothetical protein